MKKLFKLFKGLFKLAIVLVIIIVVLALVFGRDKKEEKKHEEPRTYERQEEIKPVEEVPQEVVEEPEPEVEVEEETEPEPEEVVDQNSIRPEFKESMEAYEAFFDEYVDFMKSFKEDSSSISMLTRYAEFMTKYEKAMREMDDIDESQLTEAEDHLYLETLLRINNKLAEAAIDY